MSEAMKTLSIIFGAGGMMGYIKAKITSLTKDVEENRTDIKEIERRINEKNE